MYWGVDADCLLYMIYDATTIVPPLYIIIDALQGSVGPNRVTVVGGSRRGTVGPYHGSGLYRTRLRCRGEMPPHPDRTRVRYSSVVKQACKTYSTDQQRGRSRLATQPAPPTYMRAKALKMLTTVQHSDLRRLQAHEPTTVPKISCYHHMHFALPFI